MCSAAPARSVFSRDAIDERLTAALEAHPAQIPVLLGGCGSGRTSALRHHQQRVGEQTCQYIDLERVATTPERFYRALVAASPFGPSSPGREPSGTRDAYDLTLAFLTTARTAEHGPATFLFDEILELRIFESFPGLRHAVDEILRVMAASGNRFVLTSRYVARASRLLRAVGPPFARLDTVPLTLPEIRSLLGAGGIGACAPAGTSPDEAGLDEFARVVDVLSGGHPASARAISEAMIAMRASGGVEPVSALAATLAPGGRLAERCLRSYEIRLHRARGYGALKAILDILAGEETLTLTEISHRLRRTPGSTKDYLSWLEDVDLVIARQKRYRFSDPMLRLWVRLYCRPVPPTDEIVAREVRQFALERLSTSPADAPAVPGRSRYATQPVETP